MYTNFIYHFSQIPSYAFVNLTSLILALSYLYVNSIMSYISQIPSIYQPSHPLLLRVATHFFSNSSTSQYIFQYIFNFPVYHFNRIPVHSSTPILDIPVHSSTRKYPVGYYWGYTYPMEMFLQSYLP